MPKARLFLLRLIAMIGLACAMGAATAHSVGQVQTTKYFAPETVSLLTSRAVSVPGFQVGDTVTYIIQFSPVSNAASYGANGYITDYIPPGVEVVGASFVQNAGYVGGTITFTDIAPNLPGLMPRGWGASNQQTYAASSATFNVGATYDSVANGGSGLCTANGFTTNSCTGMLSTLYADTGIFYSTDSRTGQFPALPTRLQQGVATNGYGAGNMTRGGQLMPLLGESVNQVHNLWDTCNGITFGGGTTTFAPASNQAGTLCNSGGLNYSVRVVTAGATPFRAGSAVAGPQTGYPLDYTGKVGPWQRIYYAGSRIGDASIGPALADSSAGATLQNATPLTLSDGGLATGTGWVLSTSNPLPSGVTAVRWAVGKLTVGQISYVKITLRITQPISAAGLTNGSEVFGGDASDLTSDAGGTSSSIDNPWVYLAPSVADNNSNLYVSKIPCVYSPTASTCTPLAGSTQSPGPTTITYKITYLNTGNANQTNVQLYDILPCESTANMTIGLVTGQQATGTLTTVPFSTPSPAGTNCQGTGVTRSTVTFPAMGTLGPGDGGALIFNVRNTATGQGDPINNTALLKSTEVPGGVTSNAVTFVGSTVVNQTPSVIISKSVNTTTVVAGGTLQYTIVVQNTGANSLTTLTISDVLPSMGGSPANALTRFNYVSTSSIVSSGLQTLTNVVTTTNTAALFTPALTPYNSMATNTNSVVVNWYMGQSTMTAGAITTITVVVNVGTSVAAQATPYQNSAIAQIGTTTAPIYRIDATNVAGVTVTSSLSVAKTLACYYNGATCVTPSGAGNLPNGAKVVYLVNYANTGAAAVANVGISDLLPCQLVNTSFTTATLTVSRAGAITTGSSTYIVTNGNCNALQSTVVLGTATSLPAGATGSFTVTMQLTTPTSTNTVVSNAATITGTGVASATSQVQNSVINQPNLQIIKAQTTSGVVPGGTVGYTLTITNNGTTAAQTITVYDWLPTGTPTVADTTRRFSISGTATFTGMPQGTVTTVIPPTQTPYSVGTSAANQQEIKFDFGTQTLAVGASIIINFTATVGQNLPTLTVPNYYYNNARVTYYSNQSSNSNALGISVALVANLSVNKTNGTGTVYAGGSTSYTLTVANGGPSAANGAVLLDPVAPGLSCTAVTCSVGSGGAVCPASTIGALQVGGITIATFPASSSLLFRVDCTVNATGS